MIISDKNKLSKLLYKYDPMGTTCTSNRGMEDEYDAEATDILLLVFRGVPFKQAYFSVMSEQFWVDAALASSETFEKIQLEYYQHVV